MMKILNVVGARPNFIKIAPVHRAFLQYPDMHSQIVHTGQHADSLMSGIFFEQLELPPPDYFLGISEGSTSAQTAEMISSFECIVRKEMPDLVVVVGDVTSTLACALVASHMRVPLAHVEAGLRSRDRTMPEEINRMLTDSISDDLFVTEQMAFDNLVSENVNPARIHFVGNVMIDSLVHIRGQLDSHLLLNDLQLIAGEYIVLTMHRPANVDHEAGLRKIIATLKMLGNRWKILFAMHPRTKRNLVRFGLWDEISGLCNLTILPPQGYIGFLNLVRFAAAVVTDSGGVQEETTFLGVPCITLRNSTERPVTLSRGTNYLVPDFDAQKVWNTLEILLENGSNNCTIPPLWDGNAAQRIVNILREKYINS
jgi:UDP-N-acetylglucosamine 2-epimerase (non-hydrolysing)